MQKFEEKETKVGSDDHVRSYLVRLRDFIIGRLHLTQLRREAAMSEFEHLERSAEISLRRSDKILGLNHQTAPDNYILGMPSMGNSVTDLVRDIGEWFGIANKKMEEQTETLEKSNRIIRRLIDANDKLAEEVDRLRRENEELKGRSR